MLIYGVKIAEILIKEFRW